MSSEEKTEFWKWKEYVWKSDRDWHGRHVITAGVDIGSVSSKAAVLLDGEVYCYSLYRTGFSSPDSARKVMDSLLNCTGMEMKDINFVVGTGYGRVSVPFANKTITEISCHAHGASYMNPAIRTILDMGGQDCKAIRTGADGKVAAFVMNNKCAAGTGRAMEVMADILGVPVDAIGSLSLDVKREPPLVSNTCVIFAKSEALSLLRSGWTVAEVLAGYCASVARRAATLLRQIGVEKEFTITGGIAKNIGVVTRVEEELKVKAVPVGFDPVLIGAIGAGLFAHRLWLKQHQAGDG